MNPTEQKAHTRKTDQIEQDLTDLGAATIESLEKVGASLRETNNLILTFDAQLREKIDQERTARLKLANEQRSYVDNEDRLIRQRLDLFMLRGFWSRLNWLVTGR